MFLLQFLHVCIWSRATSELYFPQPNFTDASDKIAYEGENELYLYGMLTEGVKTNLGKIQSNVGTGEEAERSTSPVRGPWDPTQGDDRQLDGRPHPVVRHFRGVI